MLRPVFGCCGTHLFPIYGCEIARDGCGLERAGRDGGAQESRAGRGAVEGCYDKSVSEHAALLLLLRLGVEAVVEAETPADRVWDALHGGVEGVLADLPFLQGGPVASPLSQSNDPGEASFYYWFPPSLHAGDWVVSIGGYARNYTPAPITRTWRG